MPIRVRCIGMYCGMYCGMYWWYVLNTYKYVFNTNRYVFNTFQPVLACIVLVLRTCWIIIRANQTECIPQYIPGNSSIKMRPWFGKISTNVSWNLQFIPTPSACCLKSRGKGYWGIIQPLINRPIGTVNGTYTEDPLKASSCGIVSTWGYRVILAKYHFSDLNIHCRRRALLWRVISLMRLAVQLRSISFLNLKA